MYDLRLFIQVVVVGIVKVEGLDASGTPGEVLEAGFVTRTADEIREHNW